MPMGNSLFSAASHSASHSSHFKRLRSLVFTGLLGVGLTACTDSPNDELAACARLVKGGLRDVADQREDRFLGKVQEDTALCRGGKNATRNQNTPWVDWANYWATRDASSKKEGSKAITLVGEHVKPNGRGIDGSLMDLEYQRIELIKFNLFDNYTYESFVKGMGGRPGSTLKQWPEMRLEPGHKYYQQVGGSGPQECRGELIRYRTLTGICNDIFNPKMGSTGTLFARNAQFESTFPRLQKNALTIARHSDAENGPRLGLLKPDPQLISRKLFTRAQSQPTNCNRGLGNSSAPQQSHCDYQKAPFFNVLAAFWIQFMTHDWFSHLQEGRNAPGLVDVGCTREARALGCRPGDRREAVLVAEEGDPDTFSHGGKNYASRAHKTTQNTITAWWDASQSRVCFKVMSKLLSSPSLISARVLRGFCARLFASRSTSWSNWSAGVDL